MKDEVLQILEKVEEIDCQIRMLQEERTRILRSDEQYAGYLDHYAAYYDDDPLPIQRFYVHMGELEAINSLFGRPDADCEQLMRTWGDRIAQLERWLAA